MKNIKKILNTNILASQMTSSLFFILETKLKKKKKNDLNSFHLSQYAFKNSSYFKLFKTLELKFPLQLTFFSNAADFNNKSIDSFTTVLLKTRHFIFTDKNLMLFSLKNEKICLIKIAACLQSGTRAFNALLATASRAK